MDRKTYRKYKIILVIILGAIIGFFNNLDASAIWPLIVPIVAFIGVIIALYYMKKKLPKEVISDEDRKIAGISARYTLKIIIVLIALVSIIFSGISKYEKIGMLASLSLFVIVLLWWVINIYVAKKEKEE